MARTPGTLLRRGTHQRRGRTHGVRRALRNREAVRAAPPSRDHGYLEPARAAGGLAGFALRRRIEHSEPVVQKLYLALDAHPRLLQVVGRKKPLGVIAVPVDQRFTFIVVAVFRQAVAD